MCPVVDKATIVFSKVGGVDCDAMLATSSASILIPSLIASSMSAIETSGKGNVLCGVCQLGCKRRFIIYDLWGLPI